MRRTRYKATVKASSSGHVARVVDEDTIEGWAPFTVFMTCSTRSDLWHVAARQSHAMITMPKAALCGAKPYHGAECRQEWLDIKEIKVCNRCRDKAIDF